jgi:type II secretory pathway pseudopilin PulG
MIGVLSAFIIVALNPFSQIQKSQDAQREHDLKQLNSAMDTFYNDANCYPMLANMPDSNSSWAGGNGQVYIQKVPVDPSALGGWPNYAYVTDTDLTDTCPQWNVVFAKVSNNYASASTLCPLTNMKDSDGSPCVPQNFIKGPDNLNPKYNYCVLSGNVDCKIIEGLKANDIPALGVASAGPGGGSVGNPGDGGNPPPPPAGGGCSCAQASHVLPPGQSCNSQWPLGSQSPGYCDQDCNIKCTP